MSDEIFTDYTQRIRNVEGIVEVVANVSCAVPGIENGNEPDGGGCGMRLCYCPDVARPEAIP